MATTYETGSSAESDLVTVTVSNTTLVGGSSFSAEVHDLISGGYSIGQLMNDGTNYIAFMIQKKWN